MALPALPAAVVDPALLAATGARKLPRAFHEIDGEGELFGLAFEGAGSHRPRMRQRKGLREELIRVHP